MIKKRIKSINLDLVAITVSLSFVGHHPALRVAKGNTRSKRDFRYLDIDLRAFSKDKPLRLTIYVLFLNISAGC